MFGHNFCMSLSKMKLLIFTIFLAAVNAQSSELNVTVFYESLCPDSIRFITTQLYPAFAELRDYLNVDFVPFGNAQISNNTDGSLNFTCQHGPNECYGNEVQACAILASEDPKYTVDFINCAMASPDPSDYWYLSPCAISNHVNWFYVTDCLSGNWQHLIRGYAAKTAAAQITWVPTIHFNGYYNDTLQDLGEHDFFNTACTLLEDEPSACASRKR